MGDNDAMGKAIESERVECRGTYGNNGCGWVGSRGELTETGCCPTCGGGYHLVAPSIRYNGMLVDMRVYKPLRDQVSAGLHVLLVQGRQIQGERRYTFIEIVPLLMVVVGDLARLVRDAPFLCEAVSKAYDDKRQELKKDLGNVILSTVRWIDDLEFDVLECLDLAIAEQEKVAASGRPR